ENHLEAKLGERFIRGVAVEEIPDAPNILITTPANVAAELLESAAPELSGALREVQYTPIVSVTAFAAQSSFQTPVKGVGVLVPAKERRQCLGILFNSSSFENRVKDESLYASFTVLLGGSAQPQWVSASDEEIKTAVRDELQELLGMKGEPLQFVINRWPRAIPKYSVGLPEVWETARATWCSEPGRLLFGNYTGQVSLRGIIETAAALG
ncbi:MAG TPA: protoporphyrinogen oxidase, partial [Pyrinomonadaceae bacterium]|nr:protoporphyrinogen oxidase [Pyrinomonadaceae bacterium]